MQRAGEILTVSDPLSSKGKVNITVIDDEDKSTHQFKMTENQLDQMVCDSKYGKWFMMQGSDYIGFPVMYDIQSNTILPNETL